MDKHNYLCARFILTHGQENIFWWFHECFVCNRNFLIFEKNLDRQETILDKTYPGDLHELWWCWTQLKDFSKIHLDDLLMFCPVNKRLESLFSWKIQERNTFKKNHSISFVSSLLIEQDICDHRNFFGVKIFDQISLREVLFVRMICTDLLICYWNPYF